MGRQTRTVENGHASRRSLLLPGLVLGLVLGAAVWFQVALDGGVDPSPAAMPVASTPMPVAEPAPPPPPPVAAPQTFVPAPPLPEERIAIEPPPAAPPGRAGIIEALRRGEVRAGSRADIERWVVAARASGQTVDSSRVRGEGLDIIVIQRDFMVPTGLTGANAVIFVLEPEVPFPRGELGHAVVLDLQSGACIGRTCSIFMGV